MIEDTISKIEEKLKENKTIPETTKNDLLHLVSNLKAEISELSLEDAQSILNFTKSSTDEATRQNKRPKLLNRSIDGLTSAVEEIENEHPKIARVTNSLIEILSNLGI